MTLSATHRQGRRLYHEMTEYAGVLRGIFAGLKPGGRLVIIEPVHDFRRKVSRAEQTAKHEISDELTAEELTTAGFQIGRRDPTFRPFSDPEGTGGWWLIVAIKPAIDVFSAALAPRA